jgi:hypothetical protein|tara:strand:- start:10394 stop:10975 length:582 start_codon:yes stop_codon:yes gene_type:complete
MAKKARKPLTEAQKEERRARLAKARANRVPTEYKSVHPDVPRDEAHPWNVKNIKKWIKTNKDELSALRKQLKLKYDKNLNNTFNTVDCYVQNLESYLRTGVYLDHRWGEQMEGKIRMVIRVPAYHFQGPYSGMLKVDLDTYNPIVGFVTKEVYAEHYGIPIDQVGMRPDDEPAPSKGLKGSKKPKPRKKRKTK